MYKKGELIVYGLTGVCVIEDISLILIKRNCEKKYYILKPLFQKGNKIYCPVDDCKVYIRPLITKIEANDLINNITCNKEEILSKSKEETDYKTRLESHNCERLVELIINIYNKKLLAAKINKKLSYNDEKYLKKAEDLLFGELATVLNMSIEKVSERVLI